MIIVDDIFGHLSSGQYDGNVVFKRGEKVSFYNIIFKKVELDVIVDGGVILPIQRRSYKYFSEHWNQSYRTDYQYVYHALDKLFRFLNHHIDMKTGTDWYLTNSYDIEHPDLMFGDFNVTGEVTHVGPRNDFECNLHVLFDLYDCTNLVFESNGDWYFQFSPKFSPDIKYTPTYLRSEAIILKSIDNKFHIKLKS